MSDQPKLAAEREKFRVEHEVQLSWKRQCSKLRKQLDAEREKVTLVTQMVQIESKRANEAEQQFTAEREIGWNEGREHERKCCEAKQQLLIDLLIRAESEWGPTHPVLSDDIKAAIAKVGK